MDALKRIPQLFFDLIAWVVPGIALLFTAVRLHPNVTWSQLLVFAAGDQLAPENVFAFAFFSTLGLGFLLGHLIAPIGETMGCWVQSSQFKAPWREYDWLRLHRPDAGPLVAKFRAEYTMHYSLAAAFCIGLVADIAMQILATPGEPMSWCPAAFVSLSALALWRGRDTERTFADSARMFYAVAQEELPVQPPVIAH